MQRNPNWSRDELILALDLFFRANRKQLDSKHPAVIELSKKLNSLQIYDNHHRNTNFRNPEGVSMKLGNFQSIDPTYLGVGLQRGGKLDKQIWDEFSNDPIYLATLAEAIGKGSNQILESITANKKELNKIDDDEEFPEGKVLTRLHKSKERNPKISALKKRKVLEEKGKLECEVCGFDFERIYGQLGHGFAECHHITPVSELADGHKTKLSDLVIVCANCHRMLHKARPMITIDQLRKSIIQNAHSKKSSVAT